MKNMKEIKCKRCGSSSFRYSIKRGKSYCLQCGLEISPSEFEKQKEVGK